MAVTGSHITDHRAIHIMTSQHNRDTIRRVGLFTVITLAKPVKKPQKGTQRDKEQAELVHRRQANAHLYEPMSNLLRRLTGDFTRPQLLDVASRLGPKKGLRVDRGAMRQKTLLICWFCENFPELVHSIQSPLRHERAGEPVVGAEPDDFDPFDLPEEWEPAPDGWL
jgi:hypothetical protein